MATTQLSFLRKRNVSSLFIKSSLIIYVWKLENYMACRKALVCVFYSEFVNIKSCDLHVDRLCLCSEPNKKRKERIDLTIYFV
jgi:hypothetical protein